LLGFTARNYLKQTCSKLHRSF